MSLPPAGWYPDPAGGAGLRYWGGSAWTEHVAESAQAAAPAAQAPPGPQSNPYLPSSLAGGAASSDPGTTGTWSSAAAMPRAAAGDPYGYSPNIPSDASSAYSLTQSPASRPVTPPPPRRSGARTGVIIAIIAVVAIGAMLLGTIALRALLGSGPALPTAADADERAIGPISAGQSYQGTLSRDQEEVISLIVDEPGIHVLSARALRPGEVDLTLSVRTTARGLASADDGGYDLVDGLGIMDPALMTWLDAGEYEVVIAEYSFSGGDFEFAAERLESTQVWLGSQTQITLNGNEKWFGHVEIEHDAELSITVVPDGSEDFLVRLVHPDGWSEVDDDGGGDLRPLLETHTSTAPGVYVVIVEEFADRGGSGTLHLD